MIFMLGGTTSKLCYPVALLMIVCVFVASTWSTAAATAGISVLVDPLTGDDSSCAVKFICRTIAYAVEQVGASHLNLSAGVFNESTVNINNAASLVISGATSASFFDCSRRLGPTTGPAFNIYNSTVTITGVTFQHCSNSNSNGGAVSAVDSSVTVSHSCFINCTAANGGALSVTGGGSGLFLHVENSTFSRNSAVAGVIGCPTGTRSSEPCSTWGGAVAAFEMWNVSVVGCTLTDNSAVAVVPSDTPQSGLSRNAVAGGGCVSLLFRGNSSASTLRFINNSFVRCEVDVSSSKNITVGNGSVLSCESVVSFWLFSFASTDACAGYGGALSVYVGLSAGLQQLHVSFFKIALQNNVFANCVLSMSVDSGNAYGGAVSLYIGGYSSMYSASDDAVAAVGDTVVRNVSVALDATRFASCSARRVYAKYRLGASVYGGSFSFYIGAYAWSRNFAYAKSSNSTCGYTHATGVHVSVQNTSSMDSEASITSDTSFGANSYGGSLSVLYVGAYAWSRSLDASSSSTCGATNASGVSVHVSSFGCSNCSALTTSGGDSLGANSYGGSISASYIGAYSYSFSLGQIDAICRSSVGATRVLDFSITIIRATIDDTMALSSERVAAPAHVKLSYCNTDTFFLFPQERVVRHSVPM
jgi:hypothetical protein